MSDGHGTIMKLVLGTLIFVGLIGFGIAFMRSLQSKVETKSNDLWNQQAPTSIVIEEQQHS